MKAKRTLAFLIFVLLAACTPSQTQILQPTQASSTTPSQAASPQATETPLPLPSAPTELERTLYTIDAVYDYDAHYLSASQSIRYVNQSEIEQNELIMLSFAHNYGADLQLTGIIREDGGEITAVEDTEGRWRLILADHLLPDHEVNLLLTFTLALPNRDGPLSWNTRQVNFIDWYPFIPPFVHSGFYEFTERTPALVGEYQVYESADFNVHLEFINAPTSLAVAAAGSGDGGDFTLGSARRFAWSASNQYEQLQSDQDGVEVAIYFFEEQRDAAEAALEVAKQALAIYSDLFGPYPYQSLSIVEATFADGMESDGLFFLDQFYFQTYSYDRRNYLTTLAAHEVAHNWWFGQVGSDQAREPWLDEAFATYSELLYYESAYPDLVDWWWDFRIERFSPAGWVNSTIYDHTEFAPYVHAVYMRGAQFLNELRAALGDEVFFAFLLNYAEAGAGSIVTRENFSTLIRQHSSAGFAPLVEKFFED